MLCPLAYGGMASVWLARFGGRKGFERLVVVKMILPQYSQDPRFQEMFVDEARIASRIEHGNVARIVDVGEQDESTFLVMEWVDGDSLSKVVRAAEQKKQRIPAGIALRVCADAAAGLHAAHVLKERDGTLLGVVHRDVSPQNILISNAGSTVLIDFGVAKARDRVSQETSAGQLKGKIRYMAPEQALGRNIDHRADVWALGAILYELFAGVPPYDGPNEVATLHKLTSGALPAPLPAYVAPPIRAMIERALAYEADARYASALELNLALEACMQEIGEPTSVAVVANYTAQLLADRKAARKRAVDTALAAAHARDAAERASSVPISVARPPGYVAAPGSHPGTGSSSGSGSRSGSGSGAPGSGGGSGSGGPPSVSLPRPSSSSTGRLSAPMPLPIAPPSHGELVSSPSNMGVSGISEVPSATSSATLGSAAMEYPPPELIDEAARRRRFMTAAILGVSVAAGVVGAVLIISTAILKRNDTGTNGATGTSHTSAPPEATDPASLGNSAPTGTNAEPPQLPTPPAVASASATTTTTGATQPPVFPTPPSTSNNGTNNGSNAGGNGTFGGATFGGSSGTTPPHRPPAPPATAPPKPAVKPPSAVPTGKSPDRGF
ncbi:MAG: serine/threonine protein kinase [Myxococcaceae bacterium]|nr:serine/threonine protein kinase [Myxococcaceae bacterium]